jgi:hypothetical protein
MAIPALAVGTMGAWISGAVICGGGDTNDASGVLASSLIA